MIIDGVEYVLVPREATTEMRDAAYSRISAEFDSVGRPVLVGVPDAIAAAIAAAPQPRVAVSGELALRVNRRWMREPGVTYEDYGREMIAAVQAELGPTLGLFAWQEPSKDECNAIHAAYNRSWSANLNSAEIHPGRAMFAAVREVMGGGE